MQFSPLFITFLPFLNCIEQLTLVERSHTPKRRNFAAPRFKYVFHRDSPFVLENVIHSPLDNKRIYTKDNFYINAIRPKEKEALLYESMLIDGKGSINDIDSFFVTSPPIRTTLSPKHSGDYDLPQLSSDIVQISQSSFRDEESVSLAAAATTTRNKLSSKNLKLVTLPPPIVSTVAPFKHNSPYQRQSNQFEPTPSQKSLIRFPAQPWQIPPINIPTTPNPLQQLFQQSMRNPPPIPPNPFFPQQPQQQQSQLSQPPPPPPPSFVWNSPPNLTSVEPFIPIPIDQPPTQFIQPPSRATNELYRQSNRVGGFSRNLPLQPIPLPNTAQIDSAFNNAREEELNSFLAPNQVAKKSIPPIDFSIDSGATSVVKSLNTPSPAGKSSEQLRKFVKVHPQVMNSLQKPMIYRGNEVVFPKMFNFTTPPSIGSPNPPQPLIPINNLTPSASASSSSFTSSYIPLMNPNQKLDLCCRKQRVGPLCQNLCSFDSFNDKTLVAAFITAQCPGPQLGQAYDCASSKADHSTCCEQVGIQAFQSGKCMPFCRTNLATPSNVLDYFVCLQVFESIKGCYRDYQLKHPNIFGD